MSVKVKKSRTSIPASFSGLTDGELALLCRDGDKAAFITIVGRHQGMITGITLAVLGDFAAAEDAAQESFVTAWKKLPSLKDPQKLRSWLGTIAKNTAISHHRKRKDSATLESQTLIDSAPRPDQLATSRDEQRAVLAALNELPEKYRLPLILFYREEHSTLSVAQTLGLSESAVKQRLSRGRKMLRERITGVIDTVLHDTLPGAVFTATVAGMIGALIKPSAIAVTAFSASQTTTTVAMTSSKFTLGAAALVTAICLPAGYSAHALFSKNSDQQISDHSSPPLIRPTSRPVAEVNPLLLEWQKMLTEYQPQNFPKLYEEIGNIDSRLRQNAFRALLSREWARQDPKAGMAFYEGQFRTSEEQSHFIWQWLEHDPRVAVNTVLTKGDPWVNLLADKFDLIAQRAPDLLTELATDPRETALKLRWSTFHYLTRLNFDKAITLLETVDEKQLPTVYSAIAVALAVTDPVTALDWVNSLPDPSARAELLPNIIGPWSESDPLAALNYAHLITHHRRAMGRFSLEALITRAAKTDLDRTLLWLKNNPSTQGARGLTEVTTEKLKSGDTTFLDRLEKEELLLPFLPAIRSLGEFNEKNSTSKTIWQWANEPERGQEAAELRRSLIHQMSFDLDTAGVITRVEELPAGQEYSRMRSETLGRILGEASTELRTDNPFPPKGTSIDFSLVIEGAPASWKEDLINGALPKMEQSMFRNTTRLDQWLEHFDRASNETRLITLKNLVPAISEEHLDHLYSGLRTDEERSAFGKYSTAK